MEVEEAPSVGMNVIYTPEKSPFITRIVYSMGESSKRSCEICFHLSTK